MRAENFKVKTIWHFLSEHYNVWNELIQWIFVIIFFFSATRWARSWGSQCQRRIVFPLFGLNKKRRVSSSRCAKRKTKKSHHQHTPVEKKIIKFVAKIIVTKVEPASSIKNSREKQITRSLNCWCFTEFFFRSDNALSAFCQKHRKTNKYCKIFANNLEGVACFSI